MSKLQNALKIKCEISGFLFMNVTDFRLKFRLKIQLKFLFYKSVGYVIKNKKGYK